MKPEIIVGYYDKNVCLENPKRRFVMTRNPSTSHELYRLEVLLPDEMDPVCVYWDEIKTIVPTSFTNGWHTRAELEPVVRLLNDALEKGWLPDFLD